MSARYGLLVVVLLLSWSLVAPTGGISTTSVNRGVDGSVASDDDAYLGVQLECQNGMLLVTITNQFPAETVLGVDITVNGTTKSIDDLEVGESQMKEFQAFDTGDTVTVTASGSGISAQLTRPLPTEC